MSRKKASPTAEVVAAPTPAARTPAASKTAVKRQSSALAKKTPASKPVRTKTATAKPLVPTKAPAKIVSKPVKIAKSEKIEKPKKAKLVRDSFTMPEDEYGQLTELKKRLLTCGVAAKKSELLRAGLALLSKQNDTNLLAQLKKIPALKTGRPTK